MKRPLFLGAGLAALAACNPWDNLHIDDYTTLDGELWDPAVVAADDGIYARLPRAGQLVRITDDGSEVVDLGAFTPDRLLGTPDGSAVLAFTSAPVCDTDDPKVETVADCLEELDESYLSYKYAMSIVRDGKEEGHFDISVPFNTVSFNGDGQQAVAYLDYSKSTDIEFEGALNLTEVVFIDFASDSVTSVPVGFSADRVLFSADQSRAVVLSRSQVVVVEMESGSYETLVTYPLTLDADDSITPLDAALTPDGRYAMITIEGSGDLYILDLEAESINMVSLDSSPADMAVDTSTDRTVLVYSGRSQVDVLEHQYFDVEVLELEEPATDILDLDGTALLYNTSSSDRHDVYRLDLATGEVVEIRMENPITRLDLAPDRSTAVALMRPEKVDGTGLEGYYDQNYGVAILDIWGAQAISLVTATQPLGLAFAGGESSQALVLLEAEDDLLQIDLGTGGTSSIRMEEPPLNIGTFGEDLFYITHDTTLGMVSFLDPSDGSMKTVSDFAASGLLKTEVPLLLEEE